MLRVQIICILYMHYVVCNRYVTYPTGITQDTPFRVRLFSQLGIATKHIQKSQTWVAYTGVVVTTYLADMKLPVPRIVYV